MPDNSITVIGNLTRTPEMRFTNSGKAVVSFGVAVNNRKKNASGGYDDDTHFFDVTAWESLAENITESIDKGSRVVVTGRLTQRSWETPDGDKRSKVEILADEVAPSLRWASAQVTKNERPQ